MCNSVCDVEWTEANAHGSPVIGYVLDYSEDGVTFTRVPEEGVLPASTHSHSMRMLRRDTLYTVRVAAVNALGESDFSETSVSRRPTLPDDPRARR